MKVGLVITYCGTGFCGWQTQPNKRSVQEELETALFNVLKEKVVLYASGRTDAGVHALGQVAHFETKKEIKPYILISVINHYLPQDVKVTKVFLPNDDFDARFSAKKKTYVYKFYSCRFELPLKIDRELRVNDNIDVGLMEKALPALIGKHNFKCFVARKSGKTNFERIIYSAKINRLSDFEFEFEITGNGFLYNMVRIIMGTLIDIGMKRKPYNCIENIIKSEDRASAGKTMPSYALYLKSVEY